MGNANGRKLQEFTMAITPHPFVLISDAERRRGEVLALVARGRLAYLPQGDASRRPWRQLSAARVVNGMLALMPAALLQSWH